MKIGFNSAIIALAVLAAVLGSPAVFAAEAGRRTISLDQDWRFHRGDVDGGQTAELDDSSWRRLDVPHDWSIEGPFNQASPSGAGGGYLDGGIGWYRKSFAPPLLTAGGRLFIEFDGAYMDSQVWINGHFLGRHPYGYTGFEYDLTPHLKPGTTNVLAVRLNVTQPCSRWYSGAGIFRHVRLTATESVHVAHWGVFVTTPKVADDAAWVKVYTQVVNQGTTDVQFRHETLILDPEGVEVARSEVRKPKSTFESDLLIPPWVTPGGREESSESLKVAHPKLWSLETPVLYSVVSRVFVGGRLVDSVSTPFGIRTFEFTRDRGFLLNGKHVPLQGVCDHHDLGCLGSAVNRRAIQRQLEILKGMGCNAIRTSHNPPAPELLDLCDRMGFLVMDEAFDEWKAGKTQHGYSRFFDQWSEPDLVSMLHRDRNHPCVVMWSIGNEIPEQGAANGYAMSKRLVDICHREDPTRPTVSACNDSGGADRTGFAKPLDVFGINYSIGAYQQFKGRYALVASETASALSTRGQYNLVPDRDGKLSIHNQDHHQVTSYDLLCPGLGLHCRDRPLGHGSLALGGRRVRLDRLRLHRRAHALRLALAELLFRHRRSVRLPQGSLLVLPQPLAAGAPGPPPALLGLAGLGGQADPRLGREQRGVRRVAAQRQIPGGKEPGSTEDTARPMGRSLRPGHAEGAGQEGRTSGGHGRSPHAGQGEAAGPRRRPLPHRRQARRPLVR